ncbi:hypothetical protein MS3_00009806, partial [Schistosoma haematobium]
AHLNLELNNYFNVILFSYRLCIIWKTNTKSNCSLVYHRKTICFEKKNGWNHYLVRKSDQSIEFLVSTPKIAHLCYERSVVGVSKCKLCSTECRKSEKSLRLPRLS